MRINAGKPLIDVIALAYQARRPVLLEGPPGVGKSEVMVAAARHLGIECIVRDLSLMEAPDLAGLPIIDPTTKTMTFAIPEFLPRTGSGLLFIEELNRAGQHVMAPCLQLLTARCLNDYTLPAGWLPVAAINPSNLDGIIADELDAALRSRFCVIEVEANVAEWLIWAEAHAVHQTVLRFVRDTPNIFATAFSSPRSWAYVSDLLIAAERGPVSTQTLMVAIAGLVGSDLAAACLAYRDLGEGAVPDATQVVHAYPTVRDLVQRMAAEGNTAFIHALVHKLLVYLQDPVNEEKATGNQVQSRHVRTAISDLPAEFRTRITERHPWAAKARK